MKVELGALLSTNKVNKIKKFILTIRVHKKYPYFWRIWVQSKPPGTLCRLFKPYISTICPQSMLVYNACTYYVTSFSCRCVVSRMPMSMQDSYVCTIPTLLMNACTVQSICNSLRITMHVIYSDHACISYAYFFFFI